MLAQNSSDVTRKIANALIEELISTDMSAYGK
jgi:hypothetical protein